jgi:hypothetical protein
MKLLRIISEIKQITKPIVLKKDSSDGLMYIARFCGMDLNMDFYDNVEFFLGFGELEIWPNELGSEVINALSTKNIPFTSHMNKETDLQYLVISDKYFEII